VVGDDDDWGYVLGVGGFDVGAVGTVGESGHLGEALEDGLGR
jgi:hypothetical protein